MARQGARNFLPAASLAASTLNKYNDAATRFLLHCDRHAILTYTSEQLDIALSDYLHLLFLSGSGISLASSTVFGIIFFIPHAAAHLPISRRALDGWRRVQPSVQHPPLTWRATLAIAAVLHHSSPRMALLVLTSFKALLRISEALNIVAADVLERRDVRAGGQLRGATLVSITLKRTKTGQNQSASLTDPSVAALLTALARSLPPSARLFPFSASVYRSHFRRATRALGLSDSFVPHSLRHGGATELWMDGLDVESILLRGRWRSNSSIRTYVQTGPALLSQSTMPPTVASLGAALEPCVLSAFRF